jgi:predicted CoA-substrate-specific enzyme activase
MSEHAGSWKLEAGGVAVRSCGLPGSSLQPPAAPAITAGIDGGSRAVKAVLWHAGERRVMARALRDSGPDPAAVAEACLAEACAAAGVQRSAVSRIAATGYARAVIAGADRRITEITCHARGVAALLPQARAVVEVGGQDSKVIRLEPGGRVADFAMNDRCAAGTGRFLEVVAERLGCGLAGYGALAAAAGQPAAISSMCVVFAESEIVGLMAQGARREDLAAGVLAAVAARVAALAGRGLPGPVACTGGVALIPGFAAALATALGEAVEVPPDPQFTGALGAALIAAG